MFEEILNLEKWIASHPNMHKVQVKRFNKEFFFYMRDSLRDDIIPISKELFLLLIEFFDSGSIVFWYQTKSERDYNSFSMLTTEFNLHLLVLSRKLFIDTLTV